MKIKTVLCNNHKIFIDSIMSYLSEYDFIELVSFALNWEDLQLTISSQSIDVIVLDFDNNDPNYFDYLLLLNKNHPTLKIVILSDNIDLFYIRRLILSGVSAYLIKNSNIEDFTKQLL